MAKDTYLGRFLEHEFQGSEDTTGEKNMFMSTISWDAAHLSAEGCSREHWQNTYAVLQELGFIDIDRLNAARAETDFIYKGNGSRCGNTNC